MAIAQITLDKYSMYYRTPVYQVGEDIVFGLRRDSIPPDVTDRIIEVTQPQANRLDLISHETLGSAELWWVIAELNHLMDPMVDADVGAKLRIPTRERVSNLLTS